MMYLVIKTVITALAYTVCSGSKSYLVDISALLDESADIATQLEVKRTIDKGLRENGVLVLVGHGLTSQLATDSFDSARKLFELDITEKLAVSIRNDNTSFGRGYLGFGDESGLSSNFEPKEGYSYGNPQRDTNAGGANLLALPNKWPSTLSAKDRSVFNSLYTEKVRVAELIVSALSECFTCVRGSQEGRDGAEAKAADLYSMIRGGHEISLMRLFHYYHQQSPTVQQHLRALQQLHVDPSDPLDPLNTTTTTVSGAAPSSMLGSSPHTDWGFLTLILADEVGGLQFLPKGSNISDESSWVDVPYVPGSLVVNGGDYLKLISRGVYHSPIHRVLSPGSKRPNNSESSVNSEITSSVGDSETSSRTTDASQDGVDLDGICSGENACPDRYSFVFFYYPSYTSPVTDNVLSHCTHYLQTQQTLSMTQNIAVDGATGESEVESEVTKGISGEAQEKNTHAFNTLLNLEGTAGSTKPHLFGDYVIQKWKGVYRREDTY